MSDQGPDKCINLGDFVKKIIGYTTTLIEFHDVNGRLITIQPDSVVNIIVDDEDGEIVASYGLYTFDIHPSEYAIIM